MRKVLPQGCGVALVTPFDDAGQLDREALRGLVEHVIAGGVAFIVALGTTGEAVSQSRTECLEVMRLIHDYAAGRVPLVAGPFGGSDTAGVVERFRGYRDVLELPGYVAAMSSVPGYVKPSQQGIYEHFMHLVEHSPLPLLLYNVPSRTGAHMTAATTLRLANASERFCGVKEASGLLPEAMLLLRERPAGFQVFSGDDTTALPLIACGGDGVVSVVANAYPEAFASMARAALAGDLRQARRHNDGLLDLHPLLYVDGNPAGIKAVLRQLGLCGDAVRLPLAPVSATTREQLIAQVLGQAVLSAPGIA